MTLPEIYDRYTPGFPGFVTAIETHCGFQISRSEIKRIAQRATTPDDFQRIWENETWWTDAEIALRDAAPDMLAALKEFFTSGDFDIVTSPDGDEAATQAWLKQARAAMDKAEGKNRA